jgi:hypothetical protein
MRKTRKNRKNCTNNFLQNWVKEYTVCKYWENTSLVLHLKG